MKEVQRGLKLAVALSSPRPGPIYCTSLGQPFALCRTGQAHGGQARGSMAVQGPTYRGGRGAKCLLLVRVNVLEGWAGG